MLDFAGFDSPETLCEMGFGRMRCSGDLVVAVAEAYEAWEDYFATDGKYDFLGPSSGLSGYVPMRAGREPKESFYYDKARTRLPGSVVDVTRHLIEQFGELELELWSALKKSTEDLPARLAPCLRVMHYPPLSPSASEGELRALPHVDTSCFTILPPASGPGLQVWSQSGHWLNVDPCENEVIVQAGERLAETSLGWQGGQIAGCLHRVIVPRGESLNGRMAIAYFI